MDDGRNADGNENAGDGAAAAHEEGFQEKLAKDFGARGADGAADADFPSALGDGDEHDVHDADAGNEQGDKSNEEQDGGEGCGDVVGRFEERGEI